MTLDIEELRGLPESLQKAANQGDELAQIVVNAASKQGVAGEYQGRRVKAEFTDNIRKVADTIASLLTQLEADRVRIEALEKGLERMRGYLVVRDNRLLASDGPARDTLTGCEIALRDLWLAVNAALGIDEGSDYSPDGRSLLSERTG